MTMRYWVWYIRKVVPRYVEEFRKSSMNWDLAEAVCMRFKTEAADVWVISSIDKQSEFVQVVTGRGKKAKVEAAKASDDRDFEGTVSVDKVAKFRIREKMKEILHIKNDGGEAVRTTVVKLTDLSRKVFETKYNNTKLGDGIDDLEKELEDARSVEQLNCDN